jgi:hypothetical protein
MLTFISAPSKELRSPMILILATIITEPKTSKKTGFKLACGWREEA